MKNKLIISQNYSFEKLINNLELIYSWVKIIIVIRVFLDVGKYNCGMNDHWIIIKYRGFSFIIFIIKIFIL